eukprot:TRINITY_DN5953_c0_g1_i1.p1 TRINITY_DN5953_c0_g1~~TRINITY_DN5953_c0_g1_i1.p1  ORF type:complete len:162 (-),score=11.97 TRINITY_DN5953_c0_g1_i1:82-567(-)
MPACQKEVRISYGQSTNNTETNAPTPLATLALRLPGVTRYVLNSRKTLRCVSVVRSIKPSPPSLCGTCRSSLEVFNGKHVSREVCSQITRCRSSTSSMFAANLVLYSKAVQQGEEDEHLAPAFTLSLSGAIEWTPAGECPGSLPPLSLLKGKGELALLRQF